MLTDDPNFYRWQDHVITPRRTAADPMATALVVLAVGSAVLFAGANADPLRPPAARAVATERTPSLSQLAKRPALLRTTRSPL